MAGRVKVREGVSIWPGFVDALTTLLIMLLFVLTVLPAMQIFLSDVLVGRDKTISELSARMQDLSRMLALERGRVEQAQRDIAGLREELRATLEQRERLERERDTLQTRIGTLEREKSTIESQKADAERRILVLDKEKADHLARIAGIGREK